MIRIGIIGLGWVGSSVAAAVLSQGVAGELLLDDVREGLAEGEAMDFAHGALLYPAARVRRAAVEEMRDCDAVVIAAGRGGRGGESRLDLLRDNMAVVEGLGRRLAGCRGVLLMVTNPVDILTEVIRRAAGLPPERAIGTGTTLDSARLRKELGDALGVHPQSIHAQVLGEHGDSSVPHWSGAQAGGRRLRQWPGWSEAREREIGERVRGAAYEIIRRKGATNHAIGMVTASLLRCIVQDEGRLLTVSRLQEGLEGVALSLPAVLGRGGATRVVEPELAPAEREGLVRSAAVLRQRMVEVGLLS